MEEIALLDNPTLHYAWGSETAIPELLGRPNPSRTPWAEMWMGAHPKAPSRVMGRTGVASLPELVRRNPEAVLGKTVSQRFGGRFPFLFKVLAAARPLSIQAHPGRVQAREGFDRENRQGISLDAPNRNYRDPNPKPECICALSTFHGLCGFRPPAEMADAFSAVVHSPAEAVRALGILSEAAGEEGIRRFFGFLMDLPRDRKAAMVQAALDRARKRESEDPALAWVVRLADAYPGDIGVLAPLMLHVVRLEPGEAMFLPPGQLHAYMEGLGIELMADSDNVLRGGLTAKHVDVGELLRVLTFEPVRPRILKAEPEVPAERLYPTNDETFRLSVISVVPGASYRSASVRSVEILICTQGAARVRRCGEKEEPLSVARGSSFIVPAGAPAYEITGAATLYKAAVPLPA